MRTRSSHLFTALITSSILLSSSFNAFAETPPATSHTIDISGAIRINLPAAGDAPVAFKTPDGKEGWVRRLSTETIPTPAYAKGRIFTGAGMGSRVFMA